MASLALELQVWYGFLFRPARLADAACPSLRPADLQILDGPGPRALMESLVFEGYAGEDITWLCYEAPDADYWAAAITASVQRSHRATGRVNTTYPDEVTERWEKSLGQLFDKLGLTSGEATWYQTCSYEPAGSQ